MHGKRKRVDPIPESFASLEDAGEFWDTHDLGDYWAHTTPVKDMVFDIKRRRYLVSLEPSLSEQLRVVASRSGVAGETLVNLWLKEKLESLNLQESKRPPKSSSPVPNAPGPRRIVMPTRRLIEME